MTNEKSLLDGLVTDYYNSIYDKFQYRLNNQWKYDTFAFIYAVCILFFIGSVIPIIAAIDKNNKFLLPIFSFFNQFIKVDISNFNFWIKWAFSVILTLAVVAIAYIPYKYWDIKTDRKSLRSRLLPFANAYSIRKELKSYLINEDPQHIRKCKAHFKKLLQNVTSFSFPKSENDRTYTTITKISKEIKEQFSWIEFIPEANLILSALNSFENKILERINQEVELDKVLQVVDFLVLYEFSKIKKSEVDPSGRMVGEMQNDYMKLFAFHLDTLSYIDSNSENFIDKQSRFKTFVNSISGFFASSNIVVMFISWLILISILLLTISSIIIKVFNLSVDSTMSIGLITTPFIGAITIVVTLYTKSKKSE